MIIFDRDHAGILLLLGGFPPRKFAPCCAKNRWVGCQDGAHPGILLSHVWLSHHQELSIWVGCHLSRIPGWPLSYMHACVRMQGPTKWKTHSLPRSNARRHAGNASLTQACAAPAARSLGLRWLGTFSSKISAITWWAHRYIFMYTFIPQTSFSLMRFLLRVKRVTKRFPTLKVTDFQLFASFTFETNEILRKISFS